MEDAEALTEVYENVSFRISSETCDRVAQSAVKIRGNVD